MGSLTRLPMLSSIYDSQVRVTDLSVARAISELTRLNLSAAPRGGRSAPRVSHGWHGAMQLTASKVAQLAPAKSEHLSPSLEFPRAFRKSPNMAAGRDLPSFLLPRICQSGVSSRDRLAKLPFDDRPSPFFLLLPALAPVTRKPVGASRRWQVAEGRRQSARARARALSAPYVCGVRRVREDWFHERGSLVPDRPDCFADARARGESGAGSSRAHGGERGGSRSTERGFIPLSAREEVLLLRRGPQRNAPRRGPGRALHARATSRRYGARVFPSIG